MQAVILSILIGLLFPGLVYSETIEQAWEVALGANHSVRAAYRTTESAEERHGAAKSQRLPTLAAHGGYLAKNDPSIVNISEFGLPSVDQFQVDEKTSYSYGASVSIPLYTSGRIRHGIDATNYGVEAAEFGEAQTIQDLKMNVAEAYVSVLRARHARTVADSQVTSLQSHAQVTENLFKQGLTDKNATLSAQVALADAKQQALQAQNGVDIANATYNRLLARPLGQDVAPEELQTDVVEGDLQDLTQRALQQRPALLALSRQVAALREKAAARRSVRGPQAALSGGYDFNKNEFQVNEGIWSVNLGLKWDLYNGGSTSHQSMAITREAEALLESRTDLESKVALEVHQAWLKLHESRERTAVTEQAIAQADENLKVSRNLFKAGMVTHTEVLDAERLRTTTASNHNNAVYDTAISGLRLRRTLGEL
ncbi:MAG TPA: TolC family protein [Halieaceae bacterium]|nr:TolC family protein [Halieaceae bacterium]